MKNNIFLLFICVLTSLLSFSVMANTCEIPAQLQNLSCVGRFKADSMSDIETYKTTYLQEGAVAKDLVIRFDLDVENFSISSPCKIIFNANRSIKSTGNICLNAKNGLHINKYANIEVKNLALYSENKIAIRPNANILGDNLTMISTGDSPESRVHIRHSSTVDLKTLIMEASRRATLGHSSQYTVSDSINLKTTGASNVLNQEFVAIWKNTSISTNELNFNSHRQIKLSTGIAITSDTLSLIAPQCKMAKTVTGVAAESCQSLITPKLKVSAKIITADESVEFNASRTTALNEIKSFSYLIDNVFYENVGDRYTHQFKNPGIYSALLVIEDILGNVVTAKKRIKVLEKQNLGELAAHFYYRQSDDNEVVAYFVPRLGSYEVSSAYYEYSDGSRVDIPHFFHLYETDLAINNDREEITLVINTTDEKVVKKTHVIELDNLSPVVNMDIYHKDEKTFIFDIVNSFDPAMSDDVNGEIDYVEIDFGDGSSEEIDFTDDTFLGFIEHEYSKAGVFTGSLTFVSYETGSSVKEFQVNTESSIDQARMVRFSTVFTDQAEHVRFQFNKSLFVNTELESVLWQYGDGTTSTTTDFEHVHFYDAGVYDVSLTAFFTDKTMQTMTQRIVVQADGPPVVAILDCWEEDTLQAGCWVAVLDKYEDMKSANIDWGDGSTTSINLTDAGYTSNDFTHEYSSEGEYQIKVDIETFRGATGSRSQSLLLEGDNGGGNGDENQIPVAVLNCYSNTPLAVVCDGGASYDPDGDIDSYTFSYQDQTISNGDGSISFIADDSGPLEVSLKVADNEGEFSELVTKVVDVKENLAPIASLVCESNESYKVSCSASQSEDVDGEIMEYRFRVGSNTYNQEDNDIQLTFDDNSAQIVYLSVVDNLGTESIEVSKEVSIKGLPPIVSFECDNSEELKLNCLASAVDPDGGDVTVKWSNGTEGIDSLFTYASMGIRDIEVIATDTEGLNTSLERSFEVIYNEPPIAGFSCLTPSKYQIICTANSLSYDSDGFIQSYRFVINGVEYVSNDGGLDISITPGDAIVSLDVMDNAGKYSNVVSKSYTIKANTIPTLSYSCSSPDFFKLECSAYSYDADGDTLSYEWEVDSQTYHSDLISVTFENGGEKSFSLRVSDGDGGEVIKEIVYEVRNNLPPSFVLNCSSSKEMEIGCTIESLSDPEGHNVSFKWYKNEVLIDNQGQSLNEKLSSYNENVNIKVVGVDEIGATFEASSEVTVIPPFIEASISCIQTGNYIIDCDGSRSYVNGSEITKYTWTINDEVVSNEKTPSFVRGSAEEIKIALEVEAFNGLLKNSILIDFITQEIPNEALPSEVILDWSFDKAYIQNKNNQKSFVVNNSAIPFDEEGFVDISISINGNVINGEDLISEGQSILLPSVFIDGLNIVEVSLVDDQGRVFEEEIEFMVGSKVLELNIIGNNSDSFEVLFYGFESGKDPYKIGTFNGSTILSSVPTVEGFIYLKGQSKSRFVYIEENELRNSVAIDFDSASYPENVDNLDFSLGIDRWNLVKGNYSVETAKDTLFKQYEAGEEQLILAPNNDGVIHIKTKIHVTSDVGQVGIPFLFDGNHLEDVYSVRISNLTQGKSVFTYGQRADFGSSNVENKISSKLLIDSNIDDLVEVEVFAIYKNIEDEVSFIEKFIKKIGVNSALASDQNRNILGLYRVTNNGISISDVYIYDERGELTGKMKNLPTGIFPPTFSVKSKNGKRYVDYEISKVIKNESFVKAYEVYVCDENVLSVSECNTIPLAEKNHFDPSRLTLQLFDNEINISSNRLYVCLVAKDGANLVLDYSCAKTADDKITFRTLISLSGNGYVGGYVSSEDRFGSKREGSLGGDDWIALSHLSLWRKISEFSHTFKDKDGNDKNYSIKVNDVSGINVHPVKIADELGHKSHGDGISMDLRFNKYSEGPSDFKGANYNNNVYTRALDIKSEGDALALKRLFNSDFGNYVKNIIVQSSDLEKLVYTKKSPFAKVVQSTCLDNGRRMRDAVVNSKKHATHFHLELVDIDKSGVFKSHVSNRIIDAFKSQIVNTDDKSIKFERNDLYPSENYKVEYFYYEKVLNNDGEYVEKSIPSIIPSSDNGISPFYRTGDTIFQSRKLPQTLFKPYEKLGEDSQKLEVRIVANIEKEKQCGQFFNQVIEFENIHYEPPSNEFYICSGSHISNDLDVTIEGISSFIIKNRYDFEMSENTCECVKNTGVIGQTYNISATGTTYLYDSNNNLVPHASVKPFQSEITLIGGGVIYANLHNYYSEAEPYRNSVQLESSPRGCDRIIYK